MICTGGAQPAGGATVESRYLLRAANRTKAPVVLRVRTEGLPAGALVDRMRDTIRRRGENISSFEVENAVLQYPGVIECAAAGIRTELGDDEVFVGVIVADPDGFDPAALCEFLSTRIATFMVPRYVEVMDDFPRNATTGRVRKHEMRARGLSDATWDRLA